ncbi:MAG: oligopeptide/dipeptide ABC transporter ATP-binding protein [Erythrobacter sp.]|nr:ATP-binding cassette domain-containing protein [Erythrobacter sp.]MDZ4273084.1 oligopeptide/dipeptide ABC transporter ATP-binding protein [Erythrobacter sp.]
MTALLEVAGLVKRFAHPRSLIDQLRGKPAGAVQAVSGVSLTIAANETLGLVGESGCGKSTVGRCILRLEQPDGGTIRLDGQDISQLPEVRLRPLRRRLQVVFQDPFASLNPRRSVGEAVAEPLRNFTDLRGGALREEVARLFERVGLRRDQIDRFPHEFSGGQRQRIGIARAIGPRPDLIILDEPVSALDVSIQAQVVNLLMDLQDEFRLSYLFIAHDLAVVRHISTRVAVMYLGEIVETGPRDAVFARPRHPYTAALLSAAPILDPAKRDAAERIILTGDLPSPSNPPSGCRFHTRCPFAQPVCSTTVPPQMDAGGGHFAACHFPL